MHREFKFFNIENRYSSTRQSPNCILKNKKIKYGEKRFSVWRMELLHPAMWVACGSGIMTVNSPSGSTMQCDMWLWDDNDMPLNSLSGSTLQCGRWQVSVSELLHSVIVHNGIYGLCTESLTLKTATSA